MKRCIAVASLMIIMMCASCASEKTKLQEVTGANAEVAEYVDDVLIEKNIEYEMVEVSENPITEGMDENWQAYDLITEDDTTYVLVLTKLGDNYAALLDGRGELLDGMVDNGVTPALFDEEGYLYSEERKNS